MRVTDITISQIKNSPESNTIRGQVIFDVFDFRTNDTDHLIFECQGQAALGQRQENIILADGMRQLRQHVQTIDETQRITFSPRIRPYSIPPVRTKMDSPAATG